MKKTLALLLAVILAMSLAACQGSSTGKSSGADTKGAADTTDKTDTAGAEENEAVSAQKDTASVGELDLDNIYEVNVTWPSLGGAPADLQVIEAAVNEICEPKLGVRVVLQPIALSDLTSQQQLLISSGEKMDVICMLWTGLDTWVNTESVLELEDYIPTYAAGIVDMFGDAAYGCQYNNHVYGISTEISGYPWGFFARTGILEKYGYDTADHKVTIEELEEMFAKVKEGEGNSYYPVAGVGSFQCLDGRYDLLGGSTYTGAIMLDGDTDTVVNMYETESYKNYAYRMYDWAQKGFISPDAATTQDSAPTLLATGNYFGAFVYLGEGTRSSYGGNGAVELTALEIQPGYTTTSDLMSVIFGISSTCEQPEKAIAFLNELYTNPDLSRILQYGIEDQHYVMVDENEKGWKQVAFPEGQDMNSSGYYVALGVWEAGGTTVWSSEKGYAQLEERAVRKNYEKSPAFGYVFNSGEFSTELTALSAVYNEYNKIIDSGAINPDQELKAFIEALEAADIGKVVEENNAQYQQWMAEN